MIDKNKRLLRETGVVRLFLALSVGLGLGTGLLAVLQASYLARVVDRVFLGGQTLSETWPWLCSLLGVIILRAGFT